MLVGKVYSEDDGNQMSLLRDGTIIRATRTVDGWTVESWTDGKTDYEWDPHGTYVSQEAALMTLYTFMTRVLHT